MTIDKDVAVQPVVKRGLATVKYLIDSGASRFSVQAFATGMLSAFGHNPIIGIRDFDGGVEFVPETYENASLRVNLRTTNLEVLDEMKGSDRKKLEQAMNEEVLDVAHFPTAAYESKKITVEKVGGDLLVAHIDGQLSFHGLTEPQSLDARVTDMDAMLRVSGEFSLRQSDYGIKPVSFAGGALRLKDELKFAFEMVARRQD